MDVCGFTMPSSAAKLSHEVLLFPLPPSWFPVWQHPKALIFLSLAAHVRESLKTLKILWIPMPSGHKWLLSILLFPSAIFGLFCLSPQAVSFSHVKHHLLCGPARWFNEQRHLLHRPGHPSSIPCRDERRICSNSVLWHTSPHTVACACHPPTPVISQNNLLILRLFRCTSYRKEMRKIFTAGIENMGD